MLDPNKKHAIPEALHNRLLIAGLVILTLAFILGISYFLSYKDAPSEPANGRNTAFNYRPDRPAGTYSSEEETKKQWTSLEIFRETNKNIFVKPSTAPIQLSTPPDAPAISTSETSVPRVVISTFPVAGPIP